jgi:uncharacterized protein (DUF2062 family)
MIPVIVFLSYRVGELFMKGQVQNIKFSEEINLKWIQLNWVQYLYGSILLAFIAGVGFGLICWIILRIFKRKMTVST